MRAHLPLYLVWASMPARLVRQSAAPQSPQPSPPTTTTTVLGHPHARYMSTTTTSPLTHMDSCSALSQRLQTSLLPCPPRLLFSHAPLTRLNRPGLPSASVTTQLRPRRWSRDCLNAHPKPDSPRRSKLNGNHATIALADLHGPVHVLALSTSSPLGM